MQKGDDMESVSERQSVLFRLPTVAACEWLMVLPATVLLAAAVLRMLQPRDYEPARTSWILLEWTATHVSRLGAAILFLGLPSIVFITGFAALLRKWRQDQALRHDAAMMFDFLRRHLAFGLLTAAVLLAGTILTAVAAHVFTD
jgi:hypothetical protein